MVPRLNQRSVWDFFVFELFFEDLASRAVGVFFADVEGNVKGIAVFAGFFGEVMKLEVVEGGAGK